MYKSKQHQLKLQYR